MVPYDTKLENETREEIDKKFELAGWVVCDKFAGQQIWTAEGCPNAQAAWTQPNQVFHEDNAFCKNISYRVGKKYAEESITNLSETTLAALQCAPKGRAPGMARDRVTPDAVGKNHSVLVDCVGVVETDKPELTEAYKAGMLESFELPPVFFEKSTIKAVA